MVTKSKFRISFLKIHKYFEVVRLSQKVPELLRIISWVHEVEVLPQLVLKTR